MSHLFDDLNNLIEEAISAEATISLELVDAQANPNVTPVPLHITSYICFFYYHLVWDYLVTGFQLELYAPREWVYVYALIITLQRNLSAFVSHMASGMSSLPPDGTFNQTNSSASASTASATTTSTKRRRRKRGPASSRADGRENSTSSVEKLKQTPISQIISLPSVSSEYWSFQVSEFLVAS